MIQYELSILMTEAPKNFEEKPKEPSALVRSKRTERLQEWLVFIGLSSLAALSFATGNVPLGIAVIIVYSLRKAVRKIEKFQQKSGKEQNTQLLHDVIRLFR